MQFDATERNDQNTYTDDFYQQYEDSRLLTIEELAGILRRKPQGLKVTLRLDNELSRKLAPAKIRIGRRVLYRASVVAKYLSDLSRQDA
ncbi:DNA-binding protein [Dyella sp.]|jgi:hypothetical protein|uniref:DNA-binding protein n=1 Tax=Dyella sp. TaxID=1869338 RepID=UPI002FD9E006